MQELIQEEIKPYENTINELQNLLDNRVYGAKEKFILILKKLKEDFGKEISKQFLFNLFSKRDLTNKQKRQKIRDLLREVETYKQGKYFRELDTCNYHTDKKEWGLNKWGEVCIKEIRTIFVSKEFMHNKKKVFQFIKIE